MTALAGVGLHFSTEKARVLSKVDLSRKGSVDEPIAELVSYVNSLKEFYTTSSCSGRLVVLQEVNAVSINSWSTASRLYLTRFNSFF